MNDQDRLRAGKHQLKYFLANQYPMWRVAMIKTIKRIMENPIDFYMPFFEDLRCNEEEKAEETITCEIRNGLIFEALAQSVQAIEDVFSLIQNCDDIAYFAKHVITYSASKVTKYIRDFDTSNTEFMLKEFGVPYFPLDEPWENQEVFESYKKAVFLIKEYLDALIAHHSKYYLHYCQYKHGLSVALRPFATGNPTGDGNPMSGAVMTFDNKNYLKRSAGQRGNFMIPHFHPDIAPVISELHAEDNLLRADLRVVDIQEFVDIAEKAYTLISTLHWNMQYACNVSDEADVHEIALPTEDYKRLLIIGFPIDK